jgi:predicted 2-oxoglutarate/Fe(II)-dependent dioxygenase YbiX/peroxiredoxin
MEQTFVNLGPGDPAPWFMANCTSNPRYAFSSAAGRYIVLCFLGTANDPDGASAIRAVLSNRHLFDDVRLSFFGVSVDPADRATGRLTESMPGLRHFWDFDCAISKAYGAVARGTEVGPKMTLRRFWLVLDPMLRVTRAFPFRPNGEEHGDLFTYLKALPQPGLLDGMQVPPPILLLPNVFEAELCQRLIDLYEAHGGEESGFMREEGGKTVMVADRNHKRRQDYTIEAPEILQSIQARIKRRIVPEISKAYQFHVTRMERYIVGCYSAADGGHFRAHRDNTTKGTAHRRFAVSINLNETFEGGEIGFPEFGPQHFKPRPGSAVVFSCSLLHAVSPVTRGRRFAFLPFLYDEAAANLRIENNKFLDPSLGEYTGS